MVCVAEDIPSPEVSPLDVEVGAEDDVVAVAGSVPPTLPPVDARSPTQMFWPRIRLVQPASKMLFYPVSDARRFDQPRLVAYGFKARI